MHRQGKPAVEWKDGGEEWYINGLIHRINGPAVTWPGGNKEYWFSGVNLEEHPLCNWLNQRNLLAAFKEGNLNKDQVLEIEMIFEY